SVEGVLGGGAGGGHGGDDAAAGAGDLLVGRPVEALLELAGAVAAEDQVGVAVDQAGGDPAAVEAVGFHRVMHRQVGARTGEGDAAVLDQDGAVLDRAKRGAAGDHGGQSAVGEEEIAHRASNPASSSPNQRPA